MFLELACEVLGIFKTEKFGSFCDGLAGMKKASGLLHHVIADEGDGSITCSLTDKVAEIVGREEKLLGEIVYSR